LEQRINTSKICAVLVTTGATTGYNVNTDLKHIFFKGANILGATQGTRKELADGLFWMSKGMDTNPLRFIF